MKATNLSFQYINVKDTGKKGSQNSCRMMTSQTSAEVKKIPGYHGCSSTATERDMQLVSSSSSESHLPEKRCYLQVAQESGCCSSSALLKMAGLTLETTPLRMVTHTAGTRCTVYANHN
jgi:hypothetical protein